MPPRPEESEEAATVESATDISPPATDEEEESCSLAPFLLARSTQLVAHSACPPTTDGPLHQLER